jgi:hypothetical protein
MGTDGYGSSQIRHDPFVICAHHSSSSRVLHAAGPAGETRASGRESGARTDARRGSSGRRGSAAGRSPRRALARSRIRVHLCASVVPSLSSSRPFASRRVLCVSTALALPPGPRAHPYPCPSVCICGSVRAAGVVSWLLASPGAAHRPPHVSGSTSPTSKHFTFPSFSS